MISFKMEEEDGNGNVDLISDLPPDVIEMILIRVGMEDAIKTSLLSKTWRNRWSTIPDLVFDDNCVSMGSEQRFIQFVTSCLLLHQGPINKFCLRASCLKNSLEIDQWLFFLSRKNVKQLSIEFAESECLRAPSYLFTCSKLTHLELCLRELYPPPSFEGFLFLKVLSLQLFLMPPEDIQKLISSCPLLENLTLESSIETELTLSAPRLKSLTLDGRYKDIYLENTPLLADVNVSQYMIIFENRSCNFDRFFGGIPRLERLVGQVHFTDYLSKGFERSSTSKQYVHLKSIELDQVCFEDMDVVPVLLRLLLDSPNLKELYILGPYSPLSYLPPDFNFWERQCPKEYKFNQLKTVKFTDMAGEINEMKFIEFILERSPVLETLTLVRKSYRLNKSAALNMLIALTRYRRASAQAVVIFDKF